MDHDVLTDALPRTIATRFELFAARLMESWISAGDVRVSANDLRMAAEFLAHVGWTVEEVAGLMVRLRNRNGDTHEMTREAALLFAVRYLTGAQP